MKSPNKAVYIMLGGFLGAGKTTAVARLAEKLRGEGLRVGLITNDQGSQLVDTAMLASRGFRVEEIAGGCFCCRFNSLVEAARKLSAETRPDVFIAEPVGSCTDLVATVSYPLRRIYGESFSIAPLSVLIDPLRALRIFGLENGASFSEKVRYIYEKQLQEANLIVINKIDLIDSGRRKQLRDALQLRFAGKQILEISARNGEGLDAWFEQITSSTEEGGKAMEVDYQLYGEGEALLGWLNATIEVRSHRRQEVDSGERDFDGNAFLHEFARELQQCLKGADAEIAHLKMTLSPDDAFSDVAVINLVRSDGTPELSQELPDSIESGELIVNIRAEADPQILRGIVLHTVKQFGSELLNLSVEHIESFRPGQPKPTHRMAAL